MNAKERLTALQAQLVKERGMKDVKFFFTRKELSLSETATDAANALEAYINGHTRPFLLNKGAARK
jgi:hypothetical protein